MAFDAEDKTEAPTPRRREEARQRGQVARSPDLTSALLLLGGMLCLYWLGPALMGRLIGVMREHLSPGGGGEWLRLDAIPLAATAGFAVLSAAGPIMLGLLVLAMLSNLLQVGFLFTTKPLEPRLDKISPLAGVRRLAGARTFVQLAMNLLKLAVVGLVAYLAVSARVGQMLMAMEMGGPEQLALISTVCYEVGIRMAIALLVLALLDFGWQRWKHERELRMTKEEVKEEMRRMEGDPIIKQRRRRMQLTAALQYMRKTVPTADVVVTNPTELAIALKYDADAMAAPKVVAKGQAYSAQKIREIAVQHGVPIVEQRPLAQAMYKAVEVGQEVPSQFYQAVAEILAYVYQLSGRAGRKPASAA